MVNVRDYTEIPDFKEALQKLEAQYQEEINDFLKQTNQMKKYNGRNNNHLKIKNGKTFPKNIINSTYNLY